MVYGVHTDHPPRGLCRAAPTLGFTLIELLVVISVIGLLLSILLPVLGKARGVAAQTRELTTGKELLAAYLMYADDNKSEVLPGYLKTDWSLPQSDQGHRFLAWASGDDARESSRLTDAPLRRYPWRLAPYHNYSYQSMIVDRQLYAEYRDFPQDPTSHHSFQFGFSNNPTFGLNTTYVGGDGHRGAFYAPSLLRWSAYYVTKVHEPVLPARLTVFASARGGHTDNAEIFVPGKHRIEGPWQATTSADTIPAFVRWPAPPGPFDPALPPVTYGHLDFRYFKRTIVATFDGHAEPLTLDDMLDMTRWSNQARSANWRPR